MPGRHSTCTPEVRAAILAARRVGAPLRACAKAAGVPWDTLIAWMRRGRKGDEPYAEFVEELDRASVQIDNVLRARCLKATEEDARPAFDMLKWREERSTRDARLRLLKAQGTVEEGRAEGTHVERVAVEGVGDELIAKLRKAIHGE